MVDVGDGEGKHVKIFELERLSRFSQSISASRFPFNKETGRRTKCVANENTRKFETRFDCVCASHVLEHMRTPNESFESDRCGARGGDDLAVAETQYGWQLSVASEG